MAGAYPDVPANRMAYDIDGTAGVRSNNNFTSGVTSMTQTELNNLNNEATTADFFSGNLANQGLGLIFPQTRDIVGMWTGWNVEFVGTWAWSPNTTNCIDGTWNTITPMFSEFTDTIPSYRSSITPYSLTGVKGMRLGFSSGTFTCSVRGWHIYGSITTGLDIDRLELWHPTLDQRVGGAHFDWGDAQRTTNATKTFRVKNLSPTLTANGVNVSFGALTDTTPSYSSMHTFSDGGAYVGTLSVGNLAPDAVSGIITIRRDFPANAVLGLWAGRINTTATSWT